MKHQRAGITTSRDGACARCSCGWQFTRPTVQAAHTAQQLHAAPTHPKGHPMTDQTPSTDDDLLETISDYAHDFDRGGHLTLDDVKHALATRDAAHDREVAAKALREAADAWRTGGWSGTPRHQDRAQDRIASAQYPGEWLHARAVSVANGLQP